MPLRRPRPDPARYSAHVSCKYAANIWTGRQAWGDHSFGGDRHPPVPIRSSGQEVVRLGGSHAGASPPRDALPQVGRGALVRRATASADGRQGSGAARAVGGIVAAGIILVRIRD